MKKIKLLIILILSITAVVIINIKIPCITNAQENNNIKTETVENVTNQFDTLESQTVKNELQDFSSGLEAITYAQEKLDKRVNYATNIYADIKMSVTIFKFNVELRSATIVNEDGVIYTTDACNMFEKWLNGQKAFQYYSKKGSDKVYCRESEQVT